jgi:putative alpha-1,2-mannosidase
VAENLSDENNYVGSIRLNGRNYDQYQLPHDSVMAGGVLQFEMVSQPRR